MSYLPDEHKEIIADELATLLYKEDLLVSFARRVSELYDDYDEYTADDIVRLMKTKLVLKHLGIIH